MSDKERIPVILSGVRTPIGRFLGGLSTLPATELGALTVQEAVKRAGIDAGAVEDVIMGNVVSAGGGQAPARQAAIKGGIPASVPALTINGKAMEKGSDFRYGIEQRLDRIDLIIWIRKEATSPVKLSLRAS